MVHILVGFGVWWVHRLIGASLELFDVEDNVLEHPRWLIEDIWLNCPTANIFVILIIVSSTLLRAARDTLALGACELREGFTHDTRLQSRMGRYR